MIGFINFSADSLCVEDVYQQYDDSSRSCDCPSACTQVCLYFLLAHKLVLYFFARTQVRFKFHLQRSLLHYFVGSCSGQELSFVSDIFNMFSDHIPADTLNLRVALKCLHGNRNLIKTYNLKIQFAARSSDVLWV